MSNHDESIVDTEVPNGITPPRRKMTEDEFVAWCDEDVKAEWVDGQVIVMAPASHRHAQIAAFLVRVVAEFVEQRNLGEVLGGEFTVRLAALRKRRVPDLLFISNDRLPLVLPNHLEGPPDLVAEIVSPDSLARDWRDKYLDYQAAGVREYWVIDPMSEHLEAYTLGDDATFKRIEEHEGRVTSTVLPGFFLKTAWLWQAELPRVRDVLREMGVP